MKPTIIQLEQSDDTPVVVSYEDAFGEFSEARGRGRAKRKKRKLERVKNRREVQEERRLARRERAQGRIANRAERQRARQEKRTANMQMRQERRKERKQFKTDRKAIGNEEDYLGEEPESTDDGGYAPQPSDDGGYAPQPTDDGSGYAPQPTDDEGGYAPQSNDGGSGYAPQGEVYQEDVTDYGSGGTGIYDDGSYAGSEDGGGYYDEESVDSETGESDDQSGFTGDLSFDGVIEMSEDDAMWNEYFSSAEGIAKINPIVADTARKIEQNKEAICLMQGQCNRLSQTNPASANKLQAQINKRQTILNNLESDLANYCKFEGDYSEARGGRKAVSKRKAEVRQAKKLARKERKEVGKLRRAEKKVKRSSKRPKGKPRNPSGIGRGIGLRRKKSLTESEFTEVDEKLNPEFGEERIVIPAEEVANFVATETLNNRTGLIGLDEQYDYDAPETRQFDLKFSNAVGDAKSGSKIDIKSIAIGVGLGVLAIYLVKKYMK